MARKSKNMVLAAGDKLDKYRAHIIEQENLSGEEHQMLERYRKAWSWLSMMYSRNQVVTLIEKEYEVSTSQAYAVVRESLTLFGDVIENDRRAQKHIMYENFMLAANLARKNTDHNAMIRALENAARIKGVFAEDESPVDASAFLSPVAIHFTTDPAALLEQARAATDTEYEPAD